MSSIGMIETYSLVPAIAALDTMLKSAHVGEVMRRNSGGGLITVLVRGDIGSVKAAVDAGTAVAESFGKVVYSNVIARPSKDLALFTKEEKPENKGTDDSDKPMVMEEMDGMAPEFTFLNFQKEVDLRRVLSRKRAYELRSILYKIDDGQIGRDHIESATKKTMTKLIVDSFRKNNMLESK